MPIRPPPRHYSCPACSWSKTVAPTSDVLIAGRDHFDACPKCGHAPLDSAPASALPAGIAQIANNLEKWLKR